MFVENEHNLTWRKGCKIFKGSPFQTAYACALLWGKERSIEKESISVGRSLKG